MIGAFYQPLRVVADLATLATLPQRELAAGLAEVIKYGPIADDGFLAWLEAHLDACWRATPRRWRTRCAARARSRPRSSAQDEREGGLRAILNFGHTFGHAIEAGLGYGEWLHGEAVGCGMVMAADLSARLGLIDAACAQRLTRLVERAGLPIVGPALGAERYLELMRVDKKAEGGEIRFVVIEAPGRAGCARRPTRWSRDVIAAHTAERRRGHVTMLRPYACDPRQSRGRRHAQAAGADAQRVPARPRPHRPQHGVPAAGLQDAGVPEPRGRPVPHPADALARGGAARPLDRARAAA